MKFANIKILTALLILNTALIAQWYAQPSGTTNALRAVYFINENTGFICGEYIILKTANGGINWTVSSSPQNNNDIVFVNSNTGFICSGAGKISKTTDGGASWVMLNSGTVNVLMRLDFIDANTGLAVGHNGTILKTTNAGLSWESIISNADTLSFYGCRIINNNNYIVTGTSSSIYRSTNAGVNWIPSTMGVVNPLWVPEFIDNNTGWITGCCGMLIKTTNFGAEWSTETYLTFGFTLYSMKFINNSTGYVCGDNGTIYRTNNQGASWDSTATFTDQIIYSLHMADANIGWAVGGYGTILKTTNGGGQGYTIGINQISAEIPNTFSLYQNYPNPFNPSTKIKFDVPPLAGSNENVKLTVYDILGNEVSVLVNSNLGAGTYEVSFDASGFPSGVYFYKLNSGTSSVSLKMVLVK